MPGEILAKGHGTGVSVESFASAIRSKPRYAQMRCHLKDALIVELLRHASLQAWSDGQLFALRVHDADQAEGKKRYMVLLLVTCQLPHKSTRRFLCSAV